MKAFLLTFSLWTLARSSPLDNNQFLICKFFQNVQSIQNELWEQKFNNFKTVLRETISVMAVYPEYKETKTNLQDYLDRGMAVPESSSIQKKIEYVQGCSSIYPSPDIDFTSEQGRRIYQPFQDYEMKMMAAYVPFQSKIVSAMEEIKLKVSPETKSDKPDIFRLIDHYLTKSGEQTEAIGVSILALKDQYQCA